MESSFNSKGQITIPKAAREHLKVRAGDRVKLFLHPDGTIVIMPKLPVTALRGMLAGIVEKPVSLEEMGAAIEAGATEAFGRMRLTKTA